MEIGKWEIIRIIKRYTTRTAFQKQLIDGGEYDNINDDILKKLPQIEVIKETC